MPYWTEHELAALSLGYDPDWPGWSVIDRMAQGCAWLSLYLHRRRLMQRAQEMGDLGPRCPPRDLLEWAQGKFDLPGELVEEVASVPSQPKRQKGNSLLTFYRFVHLVGVENGFVRHAAKGSAVGQIVTKMRLASIEIDEGTVLSAVRNAADYLAEHGRKGD
jgi:hypothetical protein